MLRHLAWLEPFWVLIIGALLLVPARFTPTAFVHMLDQARPYLVLALLVGFMVRRLAYGHLSLRTPLDVPLALLILWLPVNYWASADKLISITALGYLAFALALYFALLNWPPVQHYPQGIAWLLVLIGLGFLVATPLLSPLSTVKLFSLAALDPLFKRLVDLLPGAVNLNRIAGTLALFVPFYAALALRWDWTHRRWLPVLFLFLTMAAALAVGLTRSRGAYISILSGVSVVVFIRWPKLTAASPLLVLAIAAGLYLSGSGTLFGADASVVAGGWEGRLELWSRAIYAIQDFSFTGIGIGTFDLVIPLLYPLFLIGPGTQVSHAHNLLLQVGVDLGIPGLIAYVALHMSAFAILAVTIRRKASLLDSTLAAGVVGSLVALFVHGIVDAALWGSKPAFLSWLFLLLAVLLGLQGSNTLKAVQTRT
ncbi:MAG: O-antigen ligase family protein [Halieaceae bacterium]|nr:O-antigen ligase family protein [Halieaceae bacterium]